MIEITVCAQAHLNDGIAFIPEGMRDAQILKSVAPPGEAVLVPAVRARLGVREREEAPRIAVVRVVLHASRIAIKTLELYVEYCGVLSHLSNSAPAALADIRTPVLPVNQAILCGREATMLCTALAKRHRLNSSVRRLVTLGAGGGRFVHHRTCPICAHRQLC